MSENKATKVVQISSVHPSYDTRIFHKICKSLVANGYDVDLIIQHEKNEILEGVNIVSLPIAKKKSDRIFKIIPRLFFKCIKYPSNTVFHFHDPELLLVGLFLKKAGYKVVYDVHEDVPEDIKSKKWISPFLRKVLSKKIAFLENIGKNTFDATVTVTRTIQDRLFSPTTYLIQNFPILKKREISEGVTKSESIPKKNVFYLGDITLIRGLKEDIQAIDYVNQFSDVGFILGGKFSPPALKEKLEEEEGWKHVKFVGWINKQDFAKYTAASFVGLVTFHPEPNHIEAQPNKLFEYMYAGLPVVASNFPKWKEIIEGNECGILVNPLDPKDIGDAILWLLRHPEQANELGLKGRKAVIEKYNWENEEQKLLELYQKLSEI